MFSKLLWPPHSTTLRRLRYLGLQAETPLVTFALITAMRLPDCHFADYLA